MAEVALRVLIVDDSEKTAIKLRAFLEKRHFQASVCGDSESAISVLRRKSYDVLLLDAELPDGGALALCHQARHDVPELRVVLMVSMEADERSTALFGADAVLRKPFSGRDVRNILTDVHEQSQPPQPLHGERQAPTSLRDTDSVEPRRSDQDKSRSSLGRPVSAARGASGWSGVPEGSRVVVKGAAQGLVGGPALSQGAPPLRSAEISVASALSGSRRGFRGVQTEGQPMTFMNQTGSLEKTPFAALLYKLFANRDTGMLTLQRDGSERLIFFQNGEPIYAASNAATDAFGTILVKFGYLDLETLNDALDDRPKGVALANHLVDRGTLSPGRLLEALERQTYERVVSCFAFNTGLYTFERGDQWLDEVRPFRQNPIQLIRDGVSRFVGPNVLATQLEDYLKSYVVRTEKYEHFRPHFPVDEWSHELMDAIRGDRTLQEMTIEYGSQIMRLLRLVWSLRLADMVDFIDEPRLTAERSAGKHHVPSRLPTPHNVDPNLVARALEEARLAKASPASRTSPPASRTSPPASRTSPPASRTSPPASRTSPPASRTSPPASRTSPSASRTSPPASRSTSSMGERSNAVAPRSRSAFRREGPSDSRPSSVPVRPKSRSARRFPDPSELTAAQVAEREALSKVVFDYTMRLGQQDHWELLELTQDATSAQVRDAFQAAMSRLPTAKFDLLEPSVRRQAMEVLETLKRAFQTINDPARRKRYTERMNKRRATRANTEDRLRRRRRSASGIRGIPVKLSGNASSMGVSADNDEDASQSTAEESSSSQAEMEALSGPMSQLKRRKEAVNPDELMVEDTELEASQGELLIMMRRTKRAVQRGRWREAYKLARSAAEYDQGQNHGLNVLLAWIVYNLPHDDKRRQARVCRNRIEFELQLDNCMPDAYFYIGRIAEDGREVVDAVKHYRAALTLAPRHEEARARLEKLYNHPAVIAAQQEEGNLSGGGVFGRLVGLFKN